MRHCQRSFSPALRPPVTIDATHWTAGTRRGPSQMPDHGQRSGSPCARNPCSICQCVSRSSGAAMPEATRSFGKLVSYAGATSCQASRLCALGSHRALGMDPGAGCVHVAHALAGRPASIPDVLQWQPVADVLALEFAVGTIDRCGSWERVRVRRCE